MPKQQIGARWPHTISVRVSDEIWSKFQELTKDKKQTISELLRNYLEELLK